MYNIAEVDKFVKQQANKKMDKIYQQDKDNTPFHLGRQYREMRAVGSTLQRKQVKMFFDKNTIENNDIFQKTGEPVLRSESMKFNLLEYNEEKPCTVNPCLKDLDFAKVVDPYTAFQELEAYISGVLGAAHPKLIEITNDDMRDKKGFDKYSFRSNKHKRI